MQTRFSRCARLLAALALAFCATVVYAQNDPAKLSIAAKAIYDDSTPAVIIRWAPMDYETWQWGNAHGYRIERTTFKSDGNLLTVEETLGGKVVLAEALAPLPEEYWIDLAEVNEMAGVAAGTIYGDSVEVMSPGESGLVNMYNINLQRETRFGFSLFAADHGIEIAEAMGLAYVDNTVEQGKEYFYLILPNEPPSETEIVAGSVFIETNDTYEPPAPSTISAQPGDKEVVVSWEKAAEHYTSYLIERSSNNGQTWVQVNNRPFIYTSNIDESSPFLHFSDSLAQNNTDYVYRVRGCSPFGMVGPASDTVHVVGKPAAVRALPVVTQAEEETIGEMTFTWEFPSEFDNDIQGFDVYRAKGLDSIFVKLNTSMLASTVREFTDTDPFVVNYYMVKATDDNNYELTSNTYLAQPNDETPPSAPGVLVGQSSQEGTVTLNWSHSPEEDVMGYRVFLSNQADSNFTQITTTWINDTIYRYGLNLNTLTEKVYFRVKAIDFRENQSEFSPVCEVERPDIVPPAPPNITRVTAAPGKVFFDWALSSSQDVVEYRFQRKPNGSPGWTTLLSFDPLDSLQQAPLAFTDSTASVRKWYDYRLVAEDDAGLLGSSKVIKAKPVDNGLRDSITNFSAQYQSQHNMVFLSWGYISDPDLMGFQVFRGIDSNDIRSYKFVPLEEAAGFSVDFNLPQGYGFVDEDMDFRLPLQTVYLAQDAQTNTGGNPSGGGNTVLPINPNFPSSTTSHTTLRYRVMAKYVDGGFSPLSPIVTIQL